MPGFDQTASHSSHVYVNVEELLSLRYLAKDISLDANKKSTALLDGACQSSFRGRGMEFSEVRAYHPGDDVRNIDWRVTARTQKPYTKLFQEERERPVYIVVDQRSSMFFGSQNQFKSALAAKIATTIAWTATQNSDRIGGMIFSDKTQSDIRARRGKHATLHFIHTLVTYNQQLTRPGTTAGETNLEDVLTDLRRVAKPGSAIFIISDFHDFTERCQESLSVLSRHCDITGIQISDPLELKLPKFHALSLTDGERKLTISGKDSSFRKQYKNQYDANQMLLRQSFSNSRARLAGVSVTTPVNEFMLDLFANTRKVKGR